MSALNDRHDSIVYVYKNDTVLIDRWHTLTKIDTVYKNNTEYVHDTVSVTEKVQQTKTDKWTLKDDLKALLIGFFISMLILLTAKTCYDRNNKK